jgi:small subunit ribosomal protein S13
MRIAGIDIPNHLKLEYALRAIQGVGPITVKQLITKTNVDPHKTASEITDEEIAKIQKALDGTLYGGELRRQIAQNITRLKNINSYRGLRHKQNLPVKGQRTRTNARTKRGKRVTVGAFKKSEITKQEQTSQKTK